ncbi:DUF2889 domain-containing protein [Nocardioides sp. YIM 152588]|uniref:DUF2889 domain-containing protein n=1 Tax=Nocardioides sp. YIM 152588 TaxID=3158259 RepID=UPI0032E3EC07
MTASADALPGGGAWLEPTAAGAVRRTVTLQVAPRGSWERGSVLSASVRDLRRRPGPARELATAYDGVVCELDPSGVVEGCPGEPELEDLLVGLPAQRGLRKALAAERSRHDAPPGRRRAVGAVGDRRDAILDDVPGFLVASGYGRLYEGVVAGPQGRLRGPVRTVCVGFHQLAEHDEEFSTRRFLDRARAEEFVDADDPLVWHREEPLPPGAVRRRRLVEVAREPSGAVAFDGYFRDTFRRPNGSDLIIHEYGVSARLAGDPLVVERVEARPGDLPMEYCPLATAGLSRLAGSEVAAIDGSVRTELRGVHACTHLNDELRSLRMVPFLLAAAGTP